MLVLGVAGALLLGACGSGGDSDDSAATGSANGSVGFINVQEAGDAVDGGTLTFGSYSFPNALDPTKTQATGSTGGTEMAAIYDTLIRSDSVAGEFVPQLAESITSNEDFSSYTVKLRDGVTFSDGTVLDSAAVKWSIDRFVAAQADVAQAWSGVVESIATPDASTVEFTLQRSWDDFPVLLSMGPGMIVGQGSDANGAFAPIGAGPFTLEKFAPNEEITLSPRADYYGGTPHLGKLRFVPTAGATASLESLNSGQLNMAYIMRDEDVIKAAQDAGLSGFLDVQGLGSIGAVNNREGRPGADLRVRQAVAYGIDPEAINARANNGLGIASSAIVPETSRWNNGTEGLQYDPAKATTLLNEAKADGYNGKLTYLAMSEPSAEAAALATQASLNSIGFDVTIDYVSSVTDLVRKLYVEHDFDITRSSYAFMDEAPYLRLYAGFGSDSNNNSVGSKDPQMDELLVAVQTATTDEAKKEAISAVQLRANETVPYSLWGPASVFLAWDNDVHEVKRSADNIMLLDSVWVG